MPLSGVVSPLEKSTKLGIKSPLTGDQGWRIVAGQMGPSAFHCATVADGGEHRRIEAKNRTAMKAAEQVEVEANGDFTEPDWQKAVSPDGVRCYVTRSRSVASKAQIAAALAIPDDLSIPAFLDRRKAEAEPELRMAA